MEKLHKPLTILRLLITIGETSAPYNQFSLSLSKKQNITICTYFKSNIAPPPEIIAFEGDGSLRGFFRALKAAFDEKAYDIIHIHAPHLGFLLWVGNCIYGKSMQSTVFTVHSSYRNYKLKHRLMLIPVFVFFRRIVCCSLASFDSFPRFFKWLAGDRLCTVQNGVDIDRIDRVIGRTRPYLSSSHFTIVTIGRLIESKNLLTVLKAFQQSVDLSSYLMFIGEGDMRDLLLTRSKACGLDKQVEITGLIPREQVYENLAQADLFMSASYVEGLPVAPLEAMACGCPVLLSDIAPHREIAADADFIPLIQPDDVEGFAREIKRFRHMSASEKADLGEKCRKLVTERFSLRAMHKGYQEVYDQVLG